MPAIINSIGMLKNGGSETHTYGITMTRKVYTSSSNYYEWFASFTSNTPITSSAAFANYMQGKSQIGFSGGGYHHTTDYDFTLLPGYMHNNNVNFYCLRKANYGGENMGYGFYGGGSFSIDSNVTFTCQQIS